VEEGREGKAREGRRPTSKRGMGRMRKGERKVRTPPPKKKGKNKTCPKFQKTKAKEHVRCRF